MRNKYKESKVMTIEKRNQKLFEAIDAKDLNEVLKQISKGADVNAREDYLWFTPLHTASKMGAVEIVKVLLALGANINNQKHDLYTPLHSAVCCKRVEIVKILLEKGAITNLKDHYGLTPLRLAKNKGYDYIIDILMKYENSAPIPKSDDTSIKNASTNLMVSDRLEDIDGLIRAMDEKLNELLYKINGIYYYPLGNGKEVGRDKPIEITCEKGTKSK